MKHFVNISIIILSIISIGCKKQNSESKEFIGRWGCGKATLDIKETSEEKYEINITWSSSASEYSEWNYICKYEENLMNCTGKKTNIEFNEEGKEKRTTVYEEGKSYFKYKENKIIWEDIKEDAGKDMFFIK